MAEPDADAIAAAALAVADVASLYAGPALEFATYLPGRRVAGIRLPGDRIEVHLVAHYGAVLPGLADCVRAAVAPVACGLPVEIYIEDLNLEGADGLDDRPDASDALRPIVGDAPLVARA